MNFNYPKINLEYKKGNGPFCVAFCFPKDGPIILTGDLVTIQKYTVEHGMLCHAHLHYYHSKSSTYPKGLSPSMWTILGQTEGCSFPKFALHRWEYQKKKTKEVFTFHELMRNKSLSVLSSPAFRAELNKNYRKVYVLYKDTADSFERTRSFRTLPQKFLKELEEE